MYFSTLIHKIQNIKMFFRNVLKFYITNLLDQEIYKNLFKNSYFSKRNLYSYKTFVNLIQRHFEVEYLFCSADKSSSLNIG